VADPEAGEAGWRAPNPSWPGKYNPVITKTISFIKDVKSELSQVSWPTFPQLLDSTRVVLVAMALLAAVIGLIDLVCARLISWVIR